MRLDEYVEYDAVALGGLVREREVSASELTTLACAAADTVNGELNAIVEIFESAISDSNASQESIFSGVPCFKKDLGALIKNCGYESGSRLTSGIKTPVTDDFSTRMLASGLQIVGRATCSEFGASITTEGIANGATRNPWDVERSAGGSSGGSSALVAAGVVPIAHTNDGGGSSRIPASICGNVGMKVSRGMVSQSPNANELTSPLVSELCNSRTVRDTAAFLDVVGKQSAGEGIYKGMNRDFTFLEQLSQAPRQYKVAFSGEGWGAKPMDSHARSEVERVASLLSELGHQMEEVTPEVVTSGRYWQHLQTLITFFTYSQIDFWSDLLRVEPGGDNVEPVTLKLFEAGSTISAIEHAKAWRYMNKVSRSLGAFFQQYDLLLTPTVNQITPFIGSDLALSSDLPLCEWFELLRGYVPQSPIANATGIPAISVPVASWGNGLPLGMQFFGAMGAESTLLDIARQLEVATPWVHRRPIVFSVSGD
ncbi:hypothetical protein A9Q99_01845 [Gammaproteobacteria bacterium 45_16_T64]|nr:hypothetical protein A9Q99_01845 [Gammaproteobacteria bacterium 45_16_T64]